MGIYNFIQNVGKKIFDSKDDDIKKRDVLHQEISSLDLPAHLEVEVEGDQVSLKGNVPDTQTKEKVILALGNIEGVGEVNDQIIAAETQKEAEFVTVQTGDTLWRIADKQYGDGSKYNLIFEANKPMLKTADSIFAGQQLRIPALEVA